MIVDVHNHAIPRAVLDHVTSDDRFGVVVENEVWTGPGATIPVPPEMYDPAAKLAHLARTGIDIAVVSVPPPVYFHNVSPAAAAELCALSNDAMRGYVAGAPDQLRWLAHVPLQSPDAAIAAYKQAIADGCSGLGIGTSAGVTRLDDPQYDAFWSEVEAARKPVVLHPTFMLPSIADGPYFLDNVIGGPLETTVMVARFLSGGHLERYPSLRLVLLHGGGFMPYQLGRLLHAREHRPEFAGSPSAESMLKRFRGLYFDSVLHDKHELRYLVSRVGTDHVVLGTDMPFDMALQAPMTSLHEALSDGDVDAVAQHTPSRLFGISAPLDDDIKDDPIELFEVQN